jgi:transcriptional regulator with XRE-family HTH domain
MDTSDWSIADRLRAVRKDRGWSQTELGRRAEVHPMLISRLEKHHKKDINGITLRKLAKALRVSSDYLLGLKDEMEALLAPAA